MSTSKNNCESLKALLRSDTQVNLILIDIDNFGNINDSYGIEYGDIVLNEVEKNLNRFKFENYELYRLDSDEFGLVSNIDFDKDEVVQIAKTITSFFNETNIELDEDISIQVSLSIGIAHGKGLVVLNNARLAVKELRLYTRGTYRIYDMKSPYIRAMQDDVYWINTIQRSVVEDNVVAFFQPIVNNSTNTITKYECLTRIYDDGEYVSPYEFLKAAKKARVMSLITKSVIKQACKAFSDNEYEFSINITNDDLQLGYLKEYLLRVTGQYNISPDRVVLELLEDIPSLNAGSMIAQLNSLKRKGFKLSIDDFGSESSNFTRLLEFRPNYLKIDGAFIKNILTDKKSQIITTGIISIAHQMGIKVIAEFIHSQEVQDKMIELGVDFSQGYLFGEPSREIKSS